MNEDHDLVLVLTQIRDLLIPIASHYRGEFEEKIKQERVARQMLLAKKVVGSQSRQACLLMDGSLSQAEISRLSGMSSGNLSRLVRELNESLLLEKDSPPALNLTVSEAQAAFAGKLP